MFRRIVAVLVLISLLWASGCDRPAPGGETPQPPTPTVVAERPTDTAVPATETPVAATATVAPATDTPAAPTNTPVPPTATAIPPTATLLPPTDTPAPPTATLIPPVQPPAPSRITFQAGHTTATVVGTVRAGGVDAYVLGAMANQLMEVNVTSTTGAAMRMFIFGADGAGLPGAQAGLPHFRGTLPKTQDYLIYVASDGPSTTYNLSIVIPELIAFEPGATSAVVKGSLAAGAGRHYSLRAAQGQLLNLDLSAATNTVRMSIYGADGNVLASGAAAFSSYRDYLPSTQEYVIYLYSEVATQYALNVMIPARVSFAPGATSSSVDGVITSLYGSRQYILGLGQGQTFEVNLLSIASGVQVVVYGVDGTVLQSGMGSFAGYKGTIPITQDYIVSISLNVPSEFTVTFSAK